MKVLSIINLDFNGMSTLQIMYSSDDRPEMYAWLTHYGLESNLLDRLLDDQGGIRWRLLFGRVIDTLLLNHAEDAMLAKLTLVESS